MKKRSAQKNSPTTMSQIPLRLLLGSMGVFIFAVFAFIVVNFIAFSTTNSQAIMDLNIKARLFDNNYTPVLNTVNYILVFLMSLGIAAFLPGAISTIVAIILEKGAGRHAAN